MPVPLSSTLSTDPPAFTRSRAFFLPIEVGLKTTFTEQLPPAERVAGQLLMRLK